MARKVIINSTKTYYDNRFGCASLFWKPTEEKSVKVAWCKACDHKCSFSTCPKVNDNKVKNEE